MEKIALGSRNLLITLSNYCQAKVLLLKRKEKDFFKLKIKTTWPLPWLQTHSPPALGPMHPPGSGSVALSSAEPQ